MDIVALIDFSPDRFYMSRIGIRMLGMHYLSLMRRDETASDSSSTMVGVIDRRCTVCRVLQDAADSAKFLCNQTYCTAPDYEIELPHGQIAFAYPPAHLHFILFELMKNAFRAVTETHMDAARLPTIKILAVRGNEEDISIKIADQGGGLPRSGVPLMYSYTYTTAKTLPDDEQLGKDGARIAPIAGYGYGLPLARLYARYFGGDVRLMSMEGYGTDAYIFLKASPDDALEHLPVYVAAPPGTTAGVAHPPIATATTETVAAAAQASAAANAVASATTSEPSV